MANRCLLNILTLVFLFMFGLQTFASGPTNPRGRPRTTTAPASGQLEEIVVTGKRPTSSRSTQRTPPPEIPFEMPPVQIDPASLVIEPPQINFNIEGEANTESPAAYFTEADRDAEIVTLNNACKTQEQRAAECCMHPDRCMASSPDGNPNTDNGMAGQFAQMLMGTMAQVPTSSISQMCSRMGTLGKASATINAYLAGRCENQIRQCKSTCEESLNTFRQNNSWGETDCEDADRYEGCRHYASIVRRYGAVTESCDRMQASAAQMGQQAVASHMSSRYADLCRQQASNTNQDPFGGQDPFTADCSGAQASTPFCQNGCNRAGAANDPTCKAIAQQMSGGLNGQGSGSTDAFSKDMKDMFGNVPGDDEGMQNPLLNDVAPNNKTANVDGGGGGGGLGGGGDDGGGGGGYSGGSGGGSEGYDTDIFNGQKSGGGYSGVGSGYKSSSSNSAPAGDGTNIFGSLFNLNKYLPGGKKTAGLDANRGIASVQKDVSPASRNIFEIVSNRFYQVCLRNALQDCSTLKKIKGGR